MQLNGKCVLVKALSVGVAKEYQMDLRADLRPLGFVLRDCERIPKTKVEKFAFIFHTSQLVFA